MLNDQANVSRLCSVLNEHRERRTVVVTGAGVSLASGIATFRGDDPDAVWKRDVTELGTYQYFSQDPVGSWHWYTSRFDGVLDKQPNDAHYALATIEAWQQSGGGEFHMVTQNVDTLHEDAGARSLIKVHGSADRVRCDRIGCHYGAPAGSLARAQVDFRAFLAEPNESTLPRCPACRSFLRQHVLWFDEFYDGHEDYRWPLVLQLAATLDLLIFVGTSFSVGVTELFVRSAVGRGVPVFAIDPVLRATPSSSVVVLGEKSELLLPLVARALGADRALPPVV